MHDGLYSRDNLILSLMVVAVLVIFWALGTMMVSNALTKVLDERDERAAKRAREQAFGEWSRPSDDETDKRADGKQE